MSFRKRNAIVASPRNTSSPSTGVRKSNIVGTRPSPLDGRLTISTGTRSLDGLLAGHAGLALGTSVLLEESGTTDFGGILLRYFAAEGVVQGHRVHVLGVNDAWGRELPGTSTDREILAAHGDEQVLVQEKMKIAWRYERLGEFGRERAPAPLLSTNADNAIVQEVFCHDFDLSKRLALPSPSPLNFIPQSHEPAAGVGDASQLLFTNFIRHLNSQIGAAPPSTVHRVIIPNLLSPVTYPYGASSPRFVLQFLHSLRALLRKYPTQVAAMITLPLALYPRIAGLTRWLEILSDGVLELTPFPSHTNPTLISSSKSVTGQGESPQGLLNVLQLPTFHEKGGGGGESSGFRDDLAFTLSRRKGLMIKPFSLPPIDGDPGSQQANLEDSGGRASRPNIDF